MARDSDIDLVDDELDEDELAALGAAARSSGVVGFVGGLLVGALIGAGIALILAPERGEVIRHRIRDRLEEVRDDARERLEDWRDEAGREFRQQRRRLRRRLRSRS